MLSKSNFLILQRHEPIHTKLGICDMESAERSLKDEQPGTKHTWMSCRGVKQRWGGHRVQREPRFHGSQSNKTSGHLGGCVKHPVPSSLFGEVPAALLRVVSIECWSREASKPERSEMSCDYSKSWRSVAVLCTQQRSNTLHTSLFLTALTELGTLLIDFV